MPQRNTIEIVINATDNASRVFNSLSDNTQTIGKLAAGAIVGGFTAATAAAVGFATKGLQEFTKFQQGMQEVFSLLPGISQDAMDEMNEQVKRISMTFGTLPEEVIPAVYEALSAGIPPDNVFSFVEVANKAAIAGVTDLATAVNGISSAMNAYGYDILDAATASDVMFQTVKLGKTTFEELSNSLYNVSPTAAALGVTFEDLNAQIAAITAQGVPTSVATNQMRQMFVELSKAGGKTADTFQQLAGKTFKQFIAEGGNTQDALQLLEKYAKETGVGINDLFSSVEAGSAALSLTGRNTERFTSFLDQMATSAGSTDAAFKTMSESLQFQINRTNAKFKVLLVTVGEKLAPAFMRPVEVIGNLVGWFTALLENGGSLEDFIAYDIPQAFRPFLMIVLRARDRILDLVDVFQKIRSIWTLASGDIHTFNYIVKQIFPDTIIEQASHFLYVIDAIGKNIKKHIQPFIDFIKQNVKLQDVLTALGVAIASFIIPAMIGIGAAIAPLIATFTLLVVGVTALRKAWEKNFLGIRDITKKVFNFIGNLFGDVGDDPISGFVQSIKYAFAEIKTLPFIRNLVDMFSRLRDALAPLFTQIGIALGKLFEHLDIGQLVKIGSTLLSLTSPLGIIKLLFEKITGINFFDILITGINKFTEVLTGLNEGQTLFEALGLSDNEAIMSVVTFVNDALNSIVGFVQNTVIPGLQKLADWFIHDALPQVVDFVTTVAIPGIRTFFDWLGGVWEIVRPELEKLANWFINDALPTIVNFINNVFIPNIGAFIKILVDIWNIISPNLGKIFDWFVTDALPTITNFINNTVIPAIETFRDRLLEFWDKIKPGLESFFNWMTSTGLPLVTNFINQTVIPAIQDIIDILVDIWDVVSPALTDLFNWFMTDGLNLIESFITDIVQPTIQTFIDILKGIWNLVRTPLQNVVNFFRDHITQITGWIQPIIDTISTLISKIREFLGLNAQGQIVNTGNGQLGSFNPNGYNAPNVTSTGSFGFANGLPYAPRTMPITIHKGERVLTAQENRDLSNQNGKPQVVIENVNIGSVENQNDADKKAEMFVNGLRLQGIEI